MKSIVLLSGGLDSAVSLAYALREGRVELCLTMDYGQRAAAREISAAAALANHYTIRHQVVGLPFLKEITSTALVNQASMVPEPDDNLLDNREYAKMSAAAVWVPNRNGVFINIAASFAEAYGCGVVITGFNREEALTFPDNSEGFVKEINGALNYSTSNHVEVISYTQRLNKTEIIRLGQRLNVPWDLIWSCYYGGQSMCGKCESCRRFFRAMQAAGLTGRT